MVAAGDQLAVINGNKWEQIGANGNRWAGCGESAGCRGCCESACDGEIKNLASYFLKFTQSFQCGTIINELG